MTSIVDCSHAAVGVGPREADLAWMVPVYVQPPSSVSRASVLHGASTAKPQRAALLSGGVSAIVPVFNERDAIAATICDLDRTLSGAVADYEIIVVDDGSNDGTGAELARFNRAPRVRICRNDQNRGYGYSLKKAVGEAKFDTIVITDADGTYPIGRIPDLLIESQRSDMVVGARIGADAAVPLFRRPAKWCLRKLAGYLAGATIPDLNSGLRVMTRGLVSRFMSLLPDGFSFTTTITLAALTHDYRVRYVPISYAKRIGQSSIRPFRDTLNFLNLIVRTVLYFKPLKIFGPASAALFATAIITALVSKLAFGQLADVTCVTLAMAAFQVLAIGLLAELIEKRSPAYAATSGREQAGVKAAEQDVPRSGSLVEASAAVVRDPITRRVDHALAAAWASPADEPGTGYTFAADAVAE